MYYSLLINYSFKNGRNTATRDAFLTDVDALETIKEKVVKPYIRGEVFWVDGVELTRNAVERISIVSHELPIKTLMMEKQQKLNSGESMVHVFYTIKPKDVIKDTNCVKNITDNVLEEVRQDLTCMVMTSKQEMKVTNSKLSEINKRVFVVHGRDNSTKTEVARFLEQLSLKAIILHEQVSQGKTIIEKIEEYSDVGYGIVLYTPCDKGGLANEGEKEMKPRARQNVVFEHGYLIGKLGREKVCALMKGDVEYPNDISGVLYIKFQDNDDWKLQLAKEMKKSGMPVDMNLLV